MKLLDGVMQMKADVILADLGQRVAELERKLDIVTELKRA